MDDRGQGNWKRCMSLDGITSQGRHFAKRRANAYSGPVLQVHLVIRTIRSLGALPVSLPPATTYSNAQDYRCVTLRLLGRMSDRKLPHLSKEPK